MIPDIWGTVQENVCDTPGLMSRSPPGAHRRVSERVWCELASSLHLWRVTQPWHPVWRRARTSQHAPPSITGVDVTNKRPIQTSRGAGQFAIKVIKIKQEQWCRNLISIVFRCWSVHALMSWPSELQTWLLDSDECHWGENTQGSSLKEVKGDTSEITILIKIRYLTQVNWC